MKIILSSYFLKKLSRQLTYISIDSPSQARKFKKSIFEKIQKIKSHPFKHRKSILFEIEERRDLIFKGYIITYEVFEDRIEIIGFNKYQQDF